MDPAAEAKKRKRKRSKGGGGGAEAQAPGQQLQIKQQRGRQQQQQQQMQQLAAHKASPAALNGAQKGNKQVNQGSMYTCRLYPHGLCSAPVVHAASLRSLRITSEGTFFHPYHPIPWVAWVPKLAT
jgi:hypothetical protein